MVFFTEVLISDEEDFMLLNVSDFLSLTVTFE